MIRPAVTVSLPRTRPGAWVDSVLDRFSARADALAAALDLGRPVLVVLRGGGPPALVDGGAAEPVAEDDDPRVTARALEAALNREAWSVLLRPALPAEDLSHGQRWWLAHAARRGLGREVLAGLIARGARDPTGSAIAWRLATAIHPLFPLLLGEAPRDEPGEEPAEEPDGSMAARAAARRVADWTGLPVPVPLPCVGPEATLAPGEAVLALGALAFPLAPGERLDVALAALAPAFIDPGTVLFLCADPERIPPRLAAVALRGNGAVAVAERLVRGLARRLAEAAALPHPRHVALARRFARDPLDLVATVEASAGLAPAWQLRREGMVLAGGRAALR